MADVIGEEVAVLRRLLSLTHHPPGEGVWQGLVDRAAAFGTAATFFLLGGEPGDEVEAFAVHTLSRLVQNLNRRTESQYAVHEGRIRGRIVWPATYKARYGQDYNPDRFVCREVHRRYDTPENQLVCYLIERLSECVTAVPDALRTGLCYRAPLFEVRPQPVAECMQNVGAALARVQRNTYLRQVRLPERIGEVHLLAAESAELDEYRAVVGIYRRYQEQVVSPSWPRVAAMGQNALPLPGRADGENELWIRLAADVLRSGARP